MLREKKTTTMIEFISSLKNSAYTTCIRVIQIFIEKKDACTPHHDLLTQNLCETQWQFSFLIVSRDESYTQ